MARVTGYPDYPTLGTGTCRDFAVLMMEALRGLGLAARFVTGYLYDKRYGTTRGGGATPAWCTTRPTASSPATPSFASA